jgi:hypothetical protein
MDSLEESIATIIKGKRISELGTTLAAITDNVLNLPILFTPMLEAINYSEASVLTITTRRHIPENAILRSHRRENPKPYIIFFLLVSPYVFIFSQN